MLALTLRQDLEVHSLLLTDDKLTAIAMTITKEERLKRGFTILIKLVLESMMGYVALGSLMQKVHIANYFVENTTHLRTGCNRPS